MIASAGDVVAIVIVAVLAGVGIVTLFMSRFVKIVQQGSVGVVKRLGEFKSVDQPGLHILTPFIDRMEKVDVREFPMTGDQQAVITKDNVSLQVSATIFCQVIDVQVRPVRDQRLPVGGRPALPDGAAGGVRRALARPGLERARDDQQPHAGPHGRRHREVGGAAQPDRDPRHHPTDERGAGDVRAEGGRAAQAGRHPEVRRGAAGGRSTAPAAASRPAVLEAEGAKQSAILRAEAQMKVLELQAEGEKTALELRGQGEAARLTSIDTVTINPRTLAVLQLRALQEIASPTTPRWSCPTRRPA